MGRSMIVRKHEPPPPTSSMLPDCVEASAIQDLRTQESWRT